MNNKEIIEKVMQGNTSKKKFDAFKVMFPELYEQLAKDMREALALKELEVLKMIEERKKWIEQEDKKFPGCQSISEITELNWIMQKIKGEDLK